MLIRIAPEMFLNESYDCYTIKEVWEEMFQTTKFKNKYPWRVNFKKNIKILPSTIGKKKSFKKSLDSINALLDYSYVENKRTKRLFSISFIDRRVIAYALECKYKVSSTDVSMIDFAVQNFQSEFKGAISPLGIINQFLEKGLIKWTDEHHNFLSDWKYQEEPSQPNEEIIRFKRLTRKDYPGL